MKKENYIFKRIAKEIKMIREKSVHGKSTRTQEQYVNELEEEAGIEISIDALKKYEQGKRCCTISTLLQLVFVDDIDLNKLKKQIADGEEYHMMKDNWGDCPADIFLNIAIEFNIDLNKIKDYF